jgi:hypothetical protein
VVLIVDPVQCFVEGESANASTADVLDGKTTDPLAQAPLNHFSLSSPWMGHLLTEAQEGQ